MVARFVFLVVVAWGAAAAAAAVVAAPVVVVVAVVCHGFGGVFAEVVLVVHFNFSTGLCPETQPAVLSCGTRPLSFPTPFGPAGRVRPLQPPRGRLDKSPPGGFLLLLPVSTCLPRVGVRRRFRKSHNMYGNATSVADVEICSSARSSSTVASAAKADEGHQQKTLGQIPSALSHLPPFSWLGNTRFYAFASMHCRRM